MHRLYPRFGTGPGAVGLFVGEEGRFPFALWEQLMAII
jgi:hypothetical protein